MRLDLEKTNKCFADETEILSGGNHMIVNGREVVVQQEGNSVGIKIGGKETIYIREIYPRTQDARIEITIYDENEQQRVVYDENHKVTVF